MSCIKHSQEFGHAWTIIYSQICMTLMMLQPICRVSIVEESEDTHLNLNNLMSEVFRVTGQNEYFILSNTFLTLYMFYSFSPPFYFDIMSNNSREISLITCIPHHISMNFENE